jgi:phosphonate transport system substrate-binding protein
MADVTPNAHATPPDAKKKSSVVAGLVVPVLLILAAGVVFGVFYFLNPTQPPRKVLNGYIVAADKYGTLDGSKFTDTNGDLIADTPADAKPPKELFFCEIPGPNPDKDEETWKAFLAHMTTATGLECKYLKRVKQVDPPAGTAPTPPGEDSEEARALAADVGMVKSFGSQLKALADGQLHVTAFTTGQVREAVNTAGFRPLVVPADQDNKFTYQVKVLVPANSPAKGLADLRGKKVSVSGMSSLSSAKAPFVQLFDEHKMLPESDYAVLLPGRYDLAFAQLVKGDTDALCVASDLLARELARGEPTDDEKKRGVVKLTADKFKVLHEFGQYPKVCFGVSHKLPDDLVKKIQKGFETFPFTGPVGEKYKADGAVKFHPVDYKTDWQAVRQVEDRLTEIARVQAGKGK